MYDLVIENLPHFSDDILILEKLQLIEAEIRDRHPRVAAKLDVAIEMLLRHHSLRVQGAQEILAQLGDQAPPRKA